MSDPAALTFTNNGKPVAPSTLAAIAGFVCATFGFDADFLTLKEITK